MSTSQAQPAPSSSSPLSSPSSPPQPKLPHHIDPSPPSPALAHHKPPHQLHFTKSPKRQASDQGKVSEHFGHILFLNSLFLSLTTTHINNPDSAHYNTHDIAHLQLHHHCHFPYPHSFLYT